MKNKFLGVILTCLLSLTYLFSAVTAFGSVQQSQTDYDTFQYVSAGSYSKIGDNWTTSQSIVLTDVQFMAKRIGTQTGAVAHAYFQLYNATTQTLIYEQQLGYWQYWCDISPTVVNLNLASPQLLSAGSYSIVIHNTYGVGGSKQLMIGYSSVAKISSHKLQKYHYSTTTWSEDSSADWYFVYDFEIGTIPIFAGYYDALVTPDDVTLKSQVNANGSEITEVGFIMGTESGNLTDTYAQTISVNTTDIFYQYFTSDNLTIGETYFYKAYATNGFGTAYNIEQHFTYAPITVTTGTAGLFQHPSGSGNWTVQLGMNVNPDGAASSVSMHLGQTIGVWENDNDLKMTPLNMGNYTFDTFGTGAVWDYPLTGNTTYFYQATANFSGNIFYGLVRSFTTSSNWTANLPSVTLTRVRDLSNNYRNAENPVLEVSARITSDLDDIINQGIDASLSSSGVTLQPTIHRMGVSTVAPDGTFTAIYYLDNETWWNDDNIYFQAWCQSVDGEGKSGVYLWEMPEVTLDDDDDDDMATVEPIDTTILRWRQQLGLTGVMGAWAFMALIELLVALLFGIALYAVDLPILKIAIGVSWFLSSISVLGAFIFTGELGVWPIVILAGGVVTLLFTLVSGLLSGQRGING